MSNMDFMEKLLDEVDFEWKALGDVATITIGEFVHKNNQNPDAEYPVYNGGRTPTGDYDKYNNTGEMIIVELNRSAKEIARTFSSAFFGHGSI